MNTQRSPNYVGTVYSVNDPLIAEQKRVASILNAKRRVLELQGLDKIVVYGDRKYVTRYRVIIRPRLGKNNKYAHLYRVGGPLKRYSAQTIRPEHGSRFDVYLTHSLVERNKV